jgi:hypothetical protein
VSEIKPYCFRPKADIVISLEHAHCKRRTIGKHEGFRRFIDPEAQESSKPREAGLKVMHTLTQNYATLVSGVLIGLSEALEHGKPKTKH